MFNINSVKAKAINKINNNINLMKGKSYKLNGEDSYSPIWYMMQDINDIFDLDVSLNVFGEFEDAGEALENASDIMNKNIKVIGYFPTKQDIAHAKSEYQKINDNYSDAEILDSYNYASPKPLSDKDINYLSEEIQKAMKNATPTQDMCKKYMKDVEPYHISYWAD